MTYCFGGSPSGEGEETPCTMKLLARDGVLIHGDDNTVPRDVDNCVWLAHPSRVDVAVHCPGDADDGAMSYHLWTYNDGDYQQIASIEVTGTATTADLELTEFNPIRPSYLEDLRDGFYSGDLPTQEYKYWVDRRNYEMRDVLPMPISGAWISDTGNSFNGETNYAYNLSINHISTWNVTNEGTNLHPTHIQL